VGLTAGLAKLTESLAHRIHVLDADGLAAVFGD